MRKTPTFKDRVARAMWACDDYADRRNYTAGSMHLYTAVYALYVLACMWDERERGR